MIELQPEPSFTPPVQSRSAQDQPSTLPSPSPLLFSPACAESVYETPVNTLQCPSTAVSHYLTPEGDGEDDGEGCCADLFAQAAAVASAIKVVAPSPPLPFLSPQEFQPSSSSALKVISHPLQFDDWIEEEEEEEEEEGRVVEEAPVEVDEETKVQEAPVGKDKEEAALERAMAWMGGGWGSCEDAPNEAASPPNEKVEEEQEEEKEEEEAHLPPQLSMSPAPKTPSLPLTTLGPLQLGLLRQKEGQVQVVKKTLVGPLQQGLQKKRSQTDGGRRRNEGSDQCADDGKSKAKSAGGVISKLNDELLHFDDEE